MIPCLFDLCNNSDMLILLLYFIPLFYLLPNGRDNDLAIDRVFTENPNLKFRVLLFSGSIFRYPNFPLPELPNPNYPNAQG